MLNENDRMNLDGDSESLWMDEETRKAGRPLKGYKERNRFRGIRLTEALDEEFKYACRCAGKTYTEGMERGIELFIQEAYDNYYRSH